MGAVVYTSSRFESVNRWRHRQDIVHQMVARILLKHGARYHRRWTAELVQQTDGVQLTGS